MTLYPCGCTGTKGCPDCLHEIHAREQRLTYRLSWPFRYWLMKLRVFFTH
jgi:hypothetical protein